MFKNVKDVDDHVKKIFAQNKSEKQRNSKCLLIARYYTEVNEWSKALRYVRAYIGDVPDSAAAFRLQAKCEENLGKTESALHSYRSSLMLDNTQKDVIFKVCELLCSVEVDDEYTQYLLKEAEKLDASHPAVFKLKEHILERASTKSAGSVSHELETLIMAEQKARPTDPSPNIKLLKMYIDKGQEVKAFALAGEVESKTPFRKNISWYQSLAETIEACKSKIDNGWEFQHFRLLVLERLAALTIDKELGGTQLASKSFRKGTFENAVDVVQKLDQALFEAAKTPEPNSTSRKMLASNLIQHVSAQLAFFLACILFKKAKKDSSEWKNCSKMCGPLLLFACQTMPPELDSSWLKDLPEVKARSCWFWINDGNFRRSQAGHILLGLNAKKKFMDIISPLLVTKWQEKVYEAIFTKNSKDARTSYLMTSLDANKLYRSLPTPNDLRLSDEAAQLHLFDNLPLVVWYGLRFKALGHPWMPLSEANDDPCSVALDTLPKRPLCSAFPNLKRFTKELQGINQATPESLSQIDIDAFLFSTVNCAFSFLEEDLRRWSEDRPEVLPVSLTDSLCTPAQMLWWQMVCQILRPSTPHNNISSELRKEIKLGLETVRSIGSQSGHQDIRLLCALARFFYAKAVQAQEDGDDSNLVSALYLRSSHYWSCAKPALENIRGDRAVRLSIQDRFFNLSGKDLDASAAESLLYEACYLEGMQLVRNSRFEEAIQAFGDLSSPYASMQQAMLYRQLGDGEKSDMEMKEIYLKKSRESFYLTLDRLKKPRVDQRHPLNSTLKTHIEEVEELIHGLFPNTENHNRSHQHDILSDASDEEDFSRTPPGRVPRQSSTPFTSSRARPVTLSNGTPVNGRHQRSMQHTPMRSPAVNTPRPREEARPSPERLEAQMRQLSVQRESDWQNIARIVEASRSTDSVLRSEIQYIKDSVRDGQRDTQRELVELRREVQDMQKGFKETQADIQKIIKLVKTLQVGQSRTSSVPKESRNIPDDELYLYGEDELENELEQAQPPKQTNAAAAALLATGNLPALYNPYQQFPAPPFFPLARSVDTAALMYQNLAYLNPGALPFSEGQRLPEFPVAASQLMGGMVPLQNPQAALAGLHRVQPPVVTDISPVTTPQVPTETVPSTPVITNLTPLQALLESSPHNYQISMPAGAHIPTSCPLDKEPEIQQVSPQAILQNVPSPAFSSVTPDTQKRTPRTSRVSVGSNVSEDGELPEHDPMSDFKPIIPLPDEVVPTTGEEDETVLFEKRAKLFRYVESEWKERGVGLLKILENNITKKARILMRREQVLKVCCNHLVPSDIELTHISGNDKTWFWVANDFADESVKLEKFGVRFKTADEASAFKDVIEKVKTSMPKTPNSKTPALPSTPTTPASLPKTPAQRAPLLSTPNIPPSTTANISLGGFTFTAAPMVTLKPQEDKKVETPKKDESTKPFAAFSFGNAFGKTPTTTPTATTVTTTTTGSTPSLATTNMFSSSPFSQLSFSSIAQNANTGNTFSTPTKPIAFGGTPSPVFGSLTTPKSAVSVATVDSTATGSPGGDGDAEDFVPTADFKPVVPLPELIEVKTGEEGEEVLYEHRAKLLRFVAETKEWKERGLGNMKMTWSPETGKVRLIMRREQVLKVCCNHFLSRDMNLLPISSSDRSWTWVAQDYSEGTLETETFAIKFKLPENAIAFRDKWLEVQKAMVDGDRYYKDGKVPSAKPKAVSAPAPLAGLFKPAQGSWECKTCYVSNKPDASACVACATPKEGESKPKQPQAPQLTADKDLMKQFKKPEGSWNCDICYVSNKADDVKCVACETARPGAPAGSPDKPATKNIAPGLTFDFKTSAQGASKFSFGLPATSTAAAAPVTTTSSPAFTFGFKTPAVSTPASAPAATTTTTPSFAFGTQSSFSFGLGGKTATTTPTFGFSLPTPSTGTTADTSQAEAEESDEEVENVDIHFAPIIPLPEKVDVVTGEENEDTLYSHRAKLFRWAGGEWKERGLGDIKILKHKNNGTIRLLMRREQVLKICLNHRLTADIVFSPKGDTGRSFQWVAADFSEGEVRQEQFAVLFKTEDIAKDFLDSVHSAQSSASDQSLSVQVSSPGQISTLTNADVSTVLETSVASSALFQTPSKSFSFAQDNDPSAAVSPISFTLSSTAKDFSNKSLTTASTEEDLKIIEVIEPKVSADEVAKARALQLPDNFFAYKQRPDCKGCPGCEKDEESPAQEKPKEKSPPKTNTPLFGSVTFGTPAKETSTLNGNSGNNFNMFLPTANSASFASLAKDSPQPAFGTLSSGNAFGWGNAGTGTSIFGGAAQPASIFGGAAKPAPVFGGSPAPLFGSGSKPSPLFSTPTSTPKSLDESKGEDDEEGEEVESHDPHFDPIIPLPDIITVRTGEEDEEKVFCQRAKLFRYDDDTKEWKERGVGEMKILLHQATGRYRLLLRREQVHKVVLNQLLTKDFELQTMKTSNKAVCWGGVNYAEDEARTEKLSVRFKNEDLLSEFMTKVAEAKERLAAQPPAPMPKPTSSPSPPPTTTPGKGPQTPSDREEEEDEDEEEEAYGEEEEDDDEDDYETYDEDYQESVVTESRSTVFARKDGNPLGPWQALGVGYVKILFSPEPGHYSVVVELDVSHRGETARITLDQSSHAKSEKTQDKEVCFSGMNEAQDANRVEYYKVLFENADAAEEFQSSFSEGLAMVVNQQFES